MNTSVQSSHQDSSHTNEDLKNQVIALKKELEHSNDKYQRMSEFISTKFLEFENIISTPVTDEATDSEGLSARQLPLLPHLVDPFSSPPPASYLDSSVSTSPASRLHLTGLRQPVLIDPSSSPPQAQGTK
ncbi:hypothetical protein R6Q59_001532 [Mikania micrantha]